MSATMPPSIPPRRLPRIAVVVFDQISTAHLAAPCTLFGERHPGVPPFDFWYCRASPGPVQGAAGLQFAQLQGLESLDDADIVIVPGWTAPYTRPPAPLLQALQKASARGSTLVGLCLGTFVLAEAGLLEQHRATTHWAYADELARRFDRVTVERNVLYIDDGNILTSAGTGAALDCCLHLLGRVCGAAVSSQLAQRLVLAAHRQGHQAQVLAQPFDRTSKSSRLTELLDDVGAHLDLEHTLASLAQRAAMSPRTFTRCFKQVTGTTVQRWLLAQRLARVRELLEQSHSSVDAISRQVGFGSTVALRQNFSKAFGMTPSTWRKRYGQLTQAGAIDKRLALGNFCI
jgi:transcriptional regulator GlxA family with amidase domain